MYFNKLKNAGWLIAGSILLSSAVSTKNVPLEVGNQAPEISLSLANGETMRLSELKGKKILVNFWSVNDAESRMSNVRLAREAERNDARYIGLCTDSDRQLAAEVMKADGLSVNDLYFADRQVNDEYRLATGIRTVNIDPYGIVAEID